MRDKVKRGMKRAVRLAVTSAAGGALGATLLPLIEVLGDCGLARLSYFTTCTGALGVTLVLGEPCEEEDDEGGGPEADDPEESALFRPWSKSDPPIEQAWN